MNLEKELTHILYDHLDLGYIGNGMSVIIGQEEVAKRIVDFLNANYSYRELYFDSGQ